MRTYAQSIGCTFTAAGLGVVRTSSFAMNTVAKAPEATKQLNASAWRNGGAIIWIKRATKAKCIAFSLGKR